MVAGLCFVGLMGSGKTEVARILSNKIGWHFVDTDALLELAEGRSIAAIFREKGESYFRLEEKKLLWKLASSSRKREILATGGGGFTDIKTIRLLKRKYFVIWLKTNIKIIMDRLGEDKGHNRPMARCLLNENFIRDRSLCYGKAHGRIDTTRLTVGAVVELIIRKYLLEG